MKRFTVCFSVAEVYVTVEALDEHAAREKAKGELGELDIRSLSHQCSDHMNICDPVHVLTDEL